MTVMALLFASFLIRPSPFCVLDEVDAPLDETNVVRFGQFLKQMADRSQFIVITHNKRTMEVASSLFGVTMEEPGVSKLISVRLHDLQEVG
jgi:chromosome segregation protein